MTFEQKAAVIHDGSDAEDREAFEYLVGTYYAKACRLKVKMSMRPSWLRRRGAFRPARFCLTRLGHGGGKRSEPG